MPENKPPSITDPCCCTNHQSKEKLSALDSLERISSEEVKKEIDKLSNKYEREAAYLIVGLLNRADGDNLLVEDLQLLHTAIWEEEEAGKATAIALRIGILYGLKHKVRAKSLIAEQNRESANQRWKPSSEKLQRALEYVKLDLEANCHPEWEHVDYKNDILNKPKYYGIPDRRLRKELVNIFRERELTDRIAKGKAKHVQRIK